MQQSFLIFFVHWILWKAHLQKVFVKFITIWLIISILQELRDQRRSLSEQNEGCNAESSTDVFQSGVLHFLLAFFFQFDSNVKVHVLNASRIKSIFVLKAGHLHFATSPPPPQGKTSQSAPPPTHWWGGGGCMGGFQVVGGFGPEKKSPPPGLLSESLEGREAGVGCRWSFHSPPCQSSQMPFFP